MESLTHIGNLSIATAPAYNCWFSVCIAQTYHDLRLIVPDLPQLCKNLHTKELSVTACMWYTR